MTAYELRISDWSSDVCSSDLDDALAMGIDSAAIRHRLGQACWANEDMDAALSHLETGMGLEAGMDCRLVLVRCLIILGRYETALEVVTPALEARPFAQQAIARSEEHTSELQTLMRISYAAFCLKQ